MRCGYLGGHGVFYLVPSSSPDLDGGARDVNWGLYLQVPEAELAAMLTDRLGRTSNGSVAAGMLAPDREAALKARAGELLPEVFAQVVDVSRDTFIQAIFTVTVPGYHRGRVCLVGDAGTLDPPFTGSGVFKAINNAVELLDALNTDGDVDQALAAWSDVQLQTVATFGAAAELFERALIFDMPDLAGFDDDAFAAWNSAVWAKAATSPGAKRAIPSARAIASRISIGNRQCSKAPRTCSQKRSVSPPTNVGHPAPVPGIRGPPVIGCMAGSHRLVDDSVGDDRLPSPTRGGWAQHRARLSAAAGAQVVRVVEGSEVTHRVPTPMPSYTCAHGGHDSRALFLLCAASVTTADVAARPNAPSSTMRVDPPHVALPCAAHHGRRRPDQRCPSRRPLAHRGAG